MRRLVLGFVTAAMLMATGSVLPVLTVVAADSGPTHTVASAVYEAFIDEGYVGVTVTMTVTNDTSATPVTTGQLLVDLGDADLHVTSNGHAVGLTEQKPSAYYRFYELTFPPVAMGKSRTITATYRLPAGRPRSDSYTRLNQAHFDFWASSQNADVSSVTVIVPEGFDAVTNDRRATTSFAGGHTTFESGPIFDPSTYAMEVSGTNLSWFKRAEVTSPSGQQIVVEGWPDDLPWSFNTRILALSSMTKLEQLIGMPLPSDGPITIRESSSADLGYAYAGDFDIRTRLARVSEYNDQPGLVAHELSHAWFNDTLFDWDWQAEGYARWAEEVDPLSRPCVAPSTYPGTGSPNLGNWQFADAQATQAQIDLVDYQYDAACSIISGVADKIGDKRMHDVLAVLAGPEAAYPGITDDQAVRTAGWRGWLDAVDERGMAAAGAEDTHTVADTLVKYGIAKVDDLGDRATARAALDALRADAVGWEIPTAVFGPMAGWDFPGAEAAIAKADSIVVATRQVATLLPAADMTTDPVKTKFAAAVDLTDLDYAQTYATGQLDIAKTLADVLTREHQANGALEQIGLLGVDLPAMSQRAVAAVESTDLLTARSLTTTLDQDLSSAALTGVVRIILVLITVVVAFFVWRRFPRVGAVPAVGTPSGAAGQSYWVLPGGSPPAPAPTPAVSAPLAPAVPASEPPAAGDDPSQISIWEQPPSMTFPS